jgi:hypothetical protein
MQMIPNHMTEEVFHHHVTPDKNDFSNWVQGVFVDTTLAMELKKTHNPNEAGRIVAERVAWLQKKT